MGRSIEEIRNDIENGGTSLGIEFGSTRIKAVLVDNTTAPVAQGSYEWKTVWKTGSDLFPGRYLERSAFLLSGSGSRCKKQYGTGLAYWFYGDQRHDAWIYGI